MPIVNKAMNILPRWKGQFYTGRNICIPSVNRAAIKVHDSFQSHSKLTQFIKTRIYAPYCIIVYSEQHNNFHSNTFQQPLMPSSGFSVITLFSSQHIRMVISCKRIWND